jgi:hypothetical protein
MFGPRLRRANQVAHRRIVRRVRTWNPVFAGDDFWEHLRPRLRKYNGAHGRGCCTTPHLKQKGWRKARALWLRRMEG